MCHNLQSLVLCRPPGYPPLPSSLYSSPYMSLGHLDPPSLSQHLYDSHKGQSLQVVLSPARTGRPSGSDSDARGLTVTSASLGTTAVCIYAPVCRVVCLEGFFLPASVSQSPLHPPAPPSAPSSSTPPQRTSRDGGRERPYRGERERLREEQRPRSVVDLTLDGRSEEERRARSGDRDADSWSFHSHPHQHKSHPQTSSLEPRSRPSPPRGGAGRFTGPETDRGGRDEDGSSRPHHNQNSNNSDRQRRNDSVATSSGTLHVSYVLPPALQPSVIAGPSHPSAPREPVREQRVSAPTYVPSVEVYDERAGPIQIASQARDNRHGEKHRERERDRERESYRFPERSLQDHPRLSQSGDSSNQREEGSVICSNGSIGKRGQDTYSSSQSRFSPETRELSKHSVRLGLERSGAEPKWNTISPLANYATSHMAALAAQHGHGQPKHSPHGGHRHNSNPSQSPPPHRHSRAGEEGSQRRYLDPAALYRSGGSGGGERGSDPAEVSAMQSLIKYSGNFAADGSLAADGRGPFGGLGNIGMEAERDKERERERAGAGPLRVPPQLKREQERPDSARSFGREGDGEVRHPPVGIAVAVARQRDSTGKQSGGSSEAQRPLLPPAIKGERLTYLRLCCVGQSEATDWLGCRFLVTFCLLVTFLPVSSL